MTDMFLSAKPSSAQLNSVLETIYQTESRRVLATLIRLLGDFDLAEDALHDAFRAAAEQWAHDGIPVNPRAWLVSTGRFKAIDTLRRRSRFDALLGELAERLDHTTSDPAQQPDQAIEDDRLRLIFTCCHPALAPEARVALTLREVCGLTTEAIAHAFLTTATTLAQRIVRAKAKIRADGIPYEVPAQAELPARLDTVLQVIYLVFNEGYYATSGATLTRADLSGEALRLGRLLVELLPQPEALGLLALMLLNEARRGARTSPTGDLVLLEEQDRSLWDQAQISEGVRLAHGALAARHYGLYTLQAAIAATHATAPNFGATNWPQIIHLYDLLLQVAPSPVVALNRAVAVAMHDGPAAGLALIDQIMTDGKLADYHLAHAARADLYRRLGNIAAARAAYEWAIHLTQQEPEQRYLTRRLQELVD